MPCSPVRSRALPGFSAFSGVPCSVRASSSCPVPPRSSCSCPETSRSVRLLMPQPGCFPLRPELHLSPPGLPRHLPKSSCLRPVPPRSCSEPSSSVRRSISLSGYFPAPSGAFCFRPARRPGMKKPAGYKCRSAFNFAAIFPALPLLPDFCRRPGPYNLSSRVSSASSGRIAPWRKAACSTRCRFCPGR